MKFKIIKSVKYPKLFEIRVYLKKYDFEEFSFYLFQSLYKKTGKF